MLRALLPEALPRVQDQLGRAVTARYARPMVKVRATVLGGRLTVDEAVDLPDNTEVELIAMPVGDDDLDEDDRRALDEAIDEGDAEFERGLGIPAAQVLAEIRAIGRA